MWETKTQQHKEAVFLSRSKMMKNAGAQQSCWYLTLLLSWGGENAIHISSIFINSRYSSIKAQGVNCPAQYAHLEFL